MSQDQPPEPPNLNEYLAVLKMHVDIANGEKQAIWTRQATMLVGNSIIVATMRSDKIDPSTVLLLNIIGLLLCGAWAWMNWVGWDWFHRPLRAGAKVPVPRDLNPLAEFSNVSRCDAIFSVAMAVVALFAVIYLFGLWVGLRPIYHHDLISSVFENGGRMSAAAFTVAGLIANLVGVILLFRYGMPYRVRTGGETHLITDDPPNQAEIRKDRRYARLGWLGLVLIVFGTLAQVCGVLIG
jgi:hypothetical protein